MMIVPRKKVHSILSVVVVVVVVATLLGHGAVAQVSCDSLDPNGMLGKDEGSVVFVAFNYDLSVNETTKRSEVVSTVIPAIEVFFAIALAPLLIEDCAPAGTDTSAFADIVGIETKPEDSLTNDDCEDTIGGTKCFRVHNEMTVYVESTGKDVETLVWLAVLDRVEFLRELPAAMGFIDSSIEDIVVDTFSWVAPTSPGASAQETQDRINILEEATKDDEIREEKVSKPVVRFFNRIYNDKILFWGLITGISLVLLIVGCCLVYQSRRLSEEGKTLSMGCEECCEERCAGCKECFDKLKFWQTSDDGGLYGGTRAGGRGGMRVGGRGGMRVAGRGRYR